MSFYEIEESVPLPVKGAALKYPFHKMEVGQSFVVFSHNVDRVLASAYAYGKANKKRFTKRIINDNGDIRIWRSE